MVSLRPLNTLCDAIKSCQYLIGLCSDSIWNIKERKYRIAFFVPCTINVNIKNNMVKMLLILSDVIHLSRYSIIVFTVESHHFEYSFTLIILEEPRQNQQDCNSGCIVNCSR